MVVSRTPLIMVFFYFYPLSLLNYDSDNSINNTSVSCTYQPALKRFCLPRPFSEPQTSSSQQTMTMTLLLLHQLQVIRPRLSLLSYWGISCRCPTPYIYSALREFYFVFKKSDSFPSLCSMLDRSEIRQVLWLYSRFVLPPSFIYFSFYLSLFYLFYLALFYFSLFYLYLFYLSLLSVFFLLSNFFFLFFSALTTCMLQSHC